MVKNENWIVIATLQLPAQQRERKQHSASCCVTPFSVQVPICKIIWHFPFFETRFSLDLWFLWCCMFTSGSVDLNMFILTQIILKFIHCVFINMHFSLTFGRSLLCLSNQTLSTSIKIQ